MNFKPSPTKDKILFAMNVFIEFLSTLLKLIRGVLLA